MIFELWSSHCCNGWIFEPEIYSDTQDIIIFELKISLDGDIPYSSGSYWIYTKNSEHDRCIHNKSIITPNVCQNFNSNTISTTLSNQQQQEDTQLIICKQESLLEQLTNSQNILYFISILGGIILMYLILIAIIICKHRKIKTLEQRIEDYFEDFRSKRNSDMKAVHYPSIGSIGGGVGYHDRTNNGNTTNGANNTNKFHGGPSSHNLYKRYSVTVNDVTTPISFDIKDTNQYLQQQRNIVSNGNNVQEMSVSYSEDKSEMQCLNKQYNKTKKGKVPSYSQEDINNSNRVKKRSSKSTLGVKNGYNELVKLPNNQHKYGNSMSYDMKVPSFDMHENQKLMNNNYNDNYNNNSDEDYDVLYKQQQQQTYL